MIPREKIKSFFFLRDSNYLSPRELELFTKWLEVAVLDSIDGLIKFLACKFDKNMQDDLIQEGRLGVLRAIQNYKWDKGDFNGYASNYIRAYFSRFIIKNKNIRLPDNVARTLRIIADKQFNGEELTDKEKEIKSRDAWTISYDAPINEDGDKLLDIIPEPEKEEKVNYKEIAVSLLNQLQPREQSILREYYGVDTGIPKTYRELSKVFGISVERLRQIKTKSEYKIRKYKNGNGLVI